MGNLISFPIETNRQPRQDSSQPSPAPSMPSIAPASCSSRSSTNAVQEVSAGGIWLPHYEMMIVDDDPHFLDVGLLKKAALANGFQLRTTWCYSVPEALAKVEIVNPVFILHDLGKVFDQFTGDISDPAGGVAGILAQMSLNRKRKIGVASKLWEPRVVHPLLELGVSYFDKPSIRPDTMNEFALCIKLILKGGRYVSPAASAADEPSQLQPSDHRELKLIPLMQGRNLTEFDGRRVARMARDHMRTGMEQFLAGTIYAQPRLFTTGVPAAPEAEVCLVATDAEQITVVGAHLKQQAPVNSLTNRQLEVLERVRQLLESLTRRCRAPACGCSEEAEPTRCPCGSSGSQGLGWRRANGFKSDRCATATVRWTATALPRRWVTACCGISHSESKKVRHSKTLLVGLIKECPNDALTCLTE